MYVASQQKSWRKPNISPTVLGLNLLLLLHWIGVSQQSYFPGLAPVNYCKKSEETSNCKTSVTLYVNRLNTEESTIPYEYHHFDFCVGKENNSPLENLVEMLFGERQRPGPYKIHFLEDVECKAVCSKTYTGGSSDSDRRMMVLKEGISLNYQHHWTVDNIPVTWCYPLENSTQYCSTGFPMGCLVRSDSDADCLINPNYNRRGFYYPFNHVDLKITYHSGQNEEWGTSFRASGGRIISVEVTPSSINHVDLKMLDCKNTEPMAIKSEPLTPGEKVSIIYTYSVEFVRNDAVK